MLRALLGPAPSDTIAFECSNPLTIGYVPQVPRLFSGTIRENIVLGRNIDDDHLNEVVKLSVLDDDLAQFPRGLDTVVGARGLQVSGGQAQRIATARALVNRPELLIVDDLSSALDVTTEHALWRGLRTVPHLTILAISHRRFVLQQADQVVVLRQGRIEAVGTLKDVLNLSAEMRNLWKHSP